MPDVDFIVLDIDGGAMLRACLASIDKQSIRPREVIVFDNGSKTPTSAPGMRVVRSDANIGFAAGVNSAFLATKAEFIALVNNDVTLDPDWLATVMSAFDDSTVAAAQTVIRRDAHTIDGAGIDISDGTFRQASSGAPALLPATSETAGRNAGAPLNPWGVSATAALYRRSALGDRVFDPRFFAYYEDVELNARLHAAGWKTIVLPDVKSTHRGSASAGVLGRDAKRLRTRNRYFVARMHPGIGSIAALLREDLKLLLRGRSSLRGIAEGLWSRL
jgi:GT2 family glycosyltransferase